MKDQTSAFPRLRPGAALADRTAFNPVVENGFPALRRRVLQNGKAGCLRRLGSGPGNAGVDELKRYQTGAFLPEGKLGRRAGAR